MALARVSGGTLDALDRVRGLLLAREDLTQALSAQGDPAAFAARLAELAAALGVRFPAEAVRSLLALPPLGPGALAQPLRSCADGTPPGWRPGAVTAAGGGYAVEWVYLGARRADGGFYYEEVQRALQQPFNRLFRFCSPLADLARRPPPLHGPSPDGLVFHMSHCGSTLVSRMLAAGEEQLALGEPQPLDAALRLCLDGGLDEATQVVLLRGVAGALGEPRQAETRFFLKLDAWHIAALPLLRRTFPDARWVFLYRTPLEVLVAQLGGSGLHPLRTPPRPLGLDWDGDSLPGADYFSAALAAICEAALAGHAAGGGLLVNYSELPAAVEARILPHFGVRPSAADAAAMALAAQGDAKAPGYAFTPDSAAKQAAATPETRAIVEARLAGVYARLEAARALEA